MVLRAGEACFSWSILGDPHIETRQVLTASLLFPLPLQSWHLSGSWQKRRPRAAMTFSFLLLILCVNFHLFILLLFFLYLSVFTCLVDFIFDTNLMDFILFLSSKLYFYCVTIYSEFAFLLYSFSPLLPPIFLSISSCNFSTFCYFYIIVHMCSLYFPSPALFFPAFLGSQQKA